MPYIMLIILAIIIALLIIAVPAIRAKQEEIKRTGKYPKGHFIGLGMAFGVAIGMPLGIAIGNIALGPGMGLPLGLVIGMALEEKNKDKIRPLTKKEEEARQKAIAVGLALLVLGAIFGAVMFWRAIK